MKVHSISLSKDKMRSQAGAWEREKYLPPVPLPSHLDIIFDLEEVLHVICFMHFSRVKSQRVSIHIASF